MDDLDRRLSHSADSLRRALAGVEVPEVPAVVPPRRSLVPLGVAASLVAVLVVGAFLVGRRPANDIVLTEPTATQDAASTTPAVAPPTTKPSPRPSTGPLVSDRLPRAVSAVPPVARGESFVEPDLGTTIMRLTDSESGGVTAPASSASQVFNTDGSLMLLYRTGGGPSGHVVIDASTGDVVATPDLSAATDIEDIIWDASNPDVLRYVDPTEAALAEIDVTVGDRRVVHTFDGCDRADFGETSGAVAGRSPILTVVCRSAGGAEWIAFDTNGGTEIARKPAIATASGSFDAPLTTASGSGFVLIDDESVIVLDAALEPTGVVVEIRVSATTLALDGEGRDVLVATVFDDVDGGATGTAVGVDLVTGEQRVITGKATGYPYPPTGTTIGVAGGPGRTLVAIATSPGVVEPELLDDEVLLIDLATDTTYRLAHHRMVDADDFGNWARPFVAVAPDGSSVAFSSNLGGGTVETYIVSIPQ